MAAAKEGRSVYLVAPHPYLGDDMTATLRLWLEPGEEPSSALARRVFGDTAEPVLDPNRLEFTYTADVPSAGVHADTKPPSRLTDGRWGDASKESVQYNGNVNITADLGERKEIRELRVMAFRRADGQAGGSPFDVQRVTVSVSDDGQQWKEVARIDNDKPRESHVMLAREDRADGPLRQTAGREAGEDGASAAGRDRVDRPAQEPPAVAAAPTGPPPRPMHVKAVLDDVLLEAGVQYLYGCFATDVLRDAAGQPCGVVMANRAGRQAVVAKTIIDATPRATVARLAGAKFRPYPGGTHTFRRVVIGGEPKKTDLATARVVGPPFRGTTSQAKSPGGEFPIIEYSIPLHVDDGSYAAYMRARPTGPVADVRSRSSSSPRTSCSRCRPMRCRDGSRSPAARRRSRATAAGRLPAGRRRPPVRAGRLRRRVPRAGRPAAAARGVDGVGRAVGPGGGRRGRGVNRAPAAAGADRCRPPSRRQPRAKSASS